MKRCLLVLLLGLDWRLVMTMIMMTKSRLKTCTNAELRRRNLYY